jgi:transposase InsO family protein
MDPGKEFQNATVRNLLEEFSIQVHVTTPGHPRSHAAIERALYNNGKKA